MNLENVNKVIDSIRNSDTFNQKRWINRRKTDKRLLCYTPGCVAGHAAELEIKENNEIEGICNVNLILPTVTLSMSNRTVKTSSIRRLAKEYMELNEAQSSSLFEAFPFEKNSKKREISPVTKKEAIATLEYMKKNWHADWLAANPHRSLI